MRTIGEQIFELLKQQPVLSIVLGFVLTIIILFMFKETIISYIKKKYNLYNEDEVFEAVEGKLGSHWADQIVERVKFNRKKKR